MSVTGSQIVCFGYPAIASGGVLWYIVSMGVKNDQIKFIKDYNLLFNVPNTKASNAACERYKNEHASEFRTSDWSIEKHRKKFMDWMSGQVSRSL